MLSFLHLPRRDAFAEAAVDAGGDHVADGAAELEGGFDAAAREVGVFRVGGDEEGFYLGRELAVHLRELELVFEVGERAQAADYYAALLLAHEVDEQAVEVFDLDVRKVDERLARHYLALAEQSETPFPARIQDYALINRVLKFHQKREAMLWWNALYLRDKKRYLAGQSS